MSPTAETLREAVEAAGLALRGGFALQENERVGPLAGARAVALLGVVGARQWPAFAASPEASDGRPDPLDRWSRRVIDQMATRLGATALFPFEGPPYWPLQAWARRAEPVFASPLGMLVHPVYGLSHSYRGALAFADEIKVFAEPADDPCARCEGRPCLTACPVGAFSAAGYDVAACAGWLRGAEGGACLRGGCLARRACPVGREYGQLPEQAGFHMAAFLAAREG